MSTFLRPRFRGIRVIHGRREPATESLPGRQNCHDKLWAAACGAAVVAGLIVRFVLLQRYYLVPDADQSVLGLMARHILQGDRPVFYWGQSYTGSGEAYVTAGLFGIFGQSNLLLHLAPLAASTVFTVLTVANGWRLFGTQVAALSCVFLAVGPTMLVGWSFWAGSGYLEAMAAGSAAILLLTPSRGKEPGAGRSMLAFYLLGLAVWIQPIGAYYAVAALAGLVVGLGRAFHRSPRVAARLAMCLLLMAAFCAGASPLILYNLQHGAATLTFIGSHAGGVARATVFARALLWAGPVLIGLLPPSTDRIYFLRFIQDHFALYGLSLAVVFLLVWRGLASWRVIVGRLRAAESSGWSGEGALVALAIAVLAGYLLTGWGGQQWSGSQPRYLLPLYSAVPLAIRLAMPVEPKAWQLVVAWLAVLGIAGACIAVNTTTFARSDVTPLAEVLESHGIKAVYGDYWLVYPLMFASEERVVGVAVADDLGKGVLQNRYSSYLRAAAGTSAYAWIASVGSARERSVRRCLSRRASNYSQLRWRDQVIFLRPTKRAFPWWNGGSCPSGP